MQTIQQAIDTLQRYGFHECTQAASKQDNIQYLCAFEGPGEERDVRYCCATEDDLCALIALGEASVSR